MRFQDAFVDQVTPHRTTLAVLPLELLESQVYQSVPLINVDAVAIEKLHARTAEQMTLTGIKDACIPFTKQGIFAFKVYILKQQKKSV